MTSAPRAIRRVLRGSARLRRAIIVACVCIGVASAVLLALWLSVDPVGSLSLDGGGPLRVVDRHGVLLRSVPARDGRPGRERWIALEAMPSLAAVTLIASEDQRFFEHHGVDVWAVARALYLDVTHGALRYGASTITMQVMRMVLSVGEPRSVGNKLREAVAALKVERSYDKAKLIEHYLNRVYFGHGAYGIEAAARMYFDKAAVALSAAEVTFLMVLVRGPAYYDPFKHRARLLERRDHLLSLLVEQEKLSPEQVARIKAEPLRVALHPPRFEAPHFVDWVLSELPADVIVRGGVVHTTLDARLSRLLEARVSEHVKGLADRNVTDAGAVVLDSQRGEVLAMVGSPSYAGPEGQVNIATWRRFPGSALKPFVYATAIEHGDHPGTIAFDVIDVPSRYRAAADTHEHGPVRYREALAGSYNLAAVHVLEHVGIARVMSKLRLAGVGELAGDVEDYGLRLALGSTKVRLVDLASGYGFLVREGRVVPAHAINAVIADNGSVWRPEVKKDTRVFSPEVSFLVMDMLADPEARRPQFGPELPADMAYPVAVKTGTARGFADTVALFVTRELTAAAWTGRFDGRATDGVLGMHGAAPLARASLLAAANGQRLTLSKAPVGVVRGEVCAGSGMQPHAGCPHRKPERFASGKPFAQCTWHAPDGAVTYPAELSGWLRRHRAQ